MSTFKYFKPAELMQYGAGARDFETVIGRKGADAERVGLNNAARITRTREGFARKPEQTWNARYGMGLYGKTIDGVEWTQGAHPDAEDGMVTVRFDDGTQEYISRKDLLCVEFVEIGK
jgi:hypothetical protein